MVWKKGDIKQLMHSLKPLFILVLGNFLSIAAGFMYLLMASIQRAALKNKKLADKEEVLKENISRILNKSPMAIFIVDNKGIIN
jgi:hypothetical protein